MMMLNLQNVKAVFDEAIKVVLHPPSKTKKRKRKIGLCHVLWLVYSSLWLWFVLHLF